MLFCFLFLLTFLVTEHSVLVFLLLKISLEYFRFLKRGKVLSISFFVFTFLRSVLTVLVTSFVCAFDECPFPVLFMLLYDLLDNDLSQ